MVGIHDGYGLTLTRSSTRFSLLEEPEILAGLPCRFAPPDDRVLQARYQQSDEYLEPVLARHAREGFDGVVPALEYGVRPAGQIARKCGLPFVGWTAIQACTDKGYLRALLDGSDVPQPRWRLIDSADELARFHAGTPVVFKPTNGRASEGVKRLASAADSWAAWKEIQEVDASQGFGGVGREYRYLAEDLIDGVQVSVETLYRHGEPIFDNVTLMRTGFGDYFPIMSVTVPAPLPKTEYDDAVAASHNLGRRLSVENGFIHSEWKIAGGVPHLIECAARVPGAFTPELAVRAYGYDMYEAQIDVLSGVEPPPAPRRRERVATATWFRVPSGTVREVRGTEFLRDHPAIFASRIKVKAGDVVPVIKNGWDRVGYFAAEADSWAQMQDLITEVERNVQIRTEDPGRSNDDD